MIGQAWRDEVRRLEREINLVPLAIHHGYRVQLRESSPGSLILDGPDRLIVWRDRDGQYLYAAVNGADRGTVMDFVRHRAGQRRSAGQALMILRSWDRQPPSVPPQGPPPIRPSNGQQRELTLRWQRLSMVSSHTSLARVGLDWKMLQGRTIREDDEGNAYFPARDADGDLVGLYRFDTGLHRHDAVSTEGIYVDTVGSARGIVVAESAVDGLSFEQANGQRCHQIATFSQRTAATRRLLDLALRKLRPATIWVATSNDEGGDAGAQWIAAGIRAAGLSHLVRTAKPAARTRNTPEEDPGTGPWGPGVL